MVTVYILYLKDKSTFPKICDSHHSCTQTFSTEVNKIYIYLSFPPSLSHPPSRRGMVLCPAKNLYVTSCSLSTGTGGVEEHCRLFLLLGQPFTYAVLDSPMSTMMFKRWKLLQKHCVMSYNRLRSNTFINLGTNVFLVVVSFQGTVTHLHLYEDKSLKKTYTRFPRDYIPFAPVLRAPSRPTGPSVRLRTEGVVWVTWVAVSRTGRTSPSKRISATDGSEYDGRHYTSL